jgi:hypothetical protein
MVEREEATRAAGTEAGNSKDEQVPEGLRFAYREDLAESSPGPSPAADPGSRYRATQAQRAPARRAQQSADEAWMDKAIYVVAVVLALLVLKKTLSLF